MKRTTLFIASILLVANISIGAVVSSYDWSNVIFSSVAIVLTALFIVLTFTFPLKDGFRSSLPFLFLFFGIIEFCMGAFSRPIVTNNPYAVIAVILVASQIALLIISYSVSRGKRDV